jgi:hypothetical protein
MSVRHIYLLAIAAALGCASAATSGAPRNRNILTWEEIAAAHVSNAYDAVERLRPLWLRGHGPTSINTPGTQFATVYIDGQRYGELSTLRGLNPDLISEIRYYSGAEGSTRFGLSNVGGVIEVKMK